MANALIKLDAPPETRLGIIPMGTANDFATGLGIPDDPWEALQLALHATANPVDVGLVNGKVCLLCFTCGPQAHCRHVCADSSHHMQAGASALASSMGRCIDCDEIYQISSARSVHEWRYNILHVGISCVSCSQCIRSPAAGGSETNNLMLHHACKLL